MLAALLLFSNGVEGECVEMQWVIYQALVDPSPLLVHRHMYAHAQSAGRLPILCSRRQNVLDMGKHASCGHCSAEQIPEEAHVHKDCIGEE